MRRIGVAEPAVEDHGFGGGVGGLLPPPDVPEAEGQIIQADRQVIQNAVLVTVRMGGQDSADLHGFSDRVHALPVVPELAKLKRQVVQEPRQVPPVANCR